MVLANDFSTNEDKFANDACMYQEKEVKHCSVEIPAKSASNDSTAEDIQQVEEQIEKESVSMRVRFNLFILCIVVLVIGRLGVPDVESITVKDKVIDALQIVNDFINKSGNELYRDLMQMACSFFVDVVFLTTFGYWVVRGKGIRLPISLAIFYIVRALVQQVWISPFPEGYYWEAPLLPSLVVPYGRGSDFFFSGHSGFLVICASEWHKIKMPKMRNFAICVAIYTIFILLSYRIHYSIDVFTGVIFAEWCFGKVDLHQDKIINFFAGFKNITKLFRRHNKMIDEVLPK
jgi:hypothetical protein